MNKTAVLRVGSLLASLTFVFHAQQSRAQWDLYYAPGASNVYWDSSSVLNVTVTASAASTCYACGFAAGSTALSNAAFAGASYSGMSGFDSSASSMYPGSYSSSSSTNLLLSQPAAPTNFGSGSYVAASQDWMNATLRWNQAYQDALAVESRNLTNGNFAAGNAAIATGQSEAARLMAEAQAAINSANAMVSLAEPGNPEAYLNATREAARATELAEQAQAQAQAEAQARAQEQARAEAQAREDAAPGIIDRVFREVLGRPAPQHVIHDLLALFRDGTLNATNYREIAQRSPEAQAIAEGRARAEAEAQARYAAAPEIIDRVFRQVLGRPAPQSTIDELRAAFRNGTLSEASFRNHVANSDEAAAHIRELAISVLGRDPNSLSPVQAREAWAAILREPNATLESVRQLFASSDEAAARIRELAIGVLGRDPNSLTPAQAREAWAGMLREPNASLQSVRDAFAGTNEAAARIRDLAINVLGRDPNSLTPAQAREAWAGYLRNPGANLRGLHDVFAGSDEAAARIRDLAIGVLGREPNSLTPAQARDAWAGILRHPNANLQNVRDVFAGSDETANRIRDLAIQVLGRDPNSLTPGQARDAWAGYLRNPGTNLQGLRDAFARSDEAAARIRNLAIDILGRDPNSLTPAQARDAWAGILRNPNASLETVRSTFENSPEARATQASRDAARSLEQARVAVDSTVQSFDRGQAGNRVAEGIEANFPTQPRAPQGASTTDSSSSAAQIRAVTQQLAVNLETARGVLAGMSEGNSAERALAASLILGEGSRIPANQQRQAGREIFNSLSAEERLILLKSQTVGVSTLSRQALAGIADQLNANLEIAMRNGSRDTVRADSGLMAQLAESVRNGLWIPATQTLRSTRAELAAGVASGASLNPSTALQRAQSVVDRAAWFQDGMRMPGAGLPGNPNVSSSDRTIAQQLAQLERSWMANPYSGVASQRDLNSLLNFATGTSLAADAVSLRAGLLSAIPAVAASLLSGVLTERVAAAQATLNSNYGLATNTNHDRISTARAVQQASQALTTAVAVGQISRSILDFAGNIVSSGPVFWRRAASDATADASRAPSSVANGATTPFPPMPANFSERFNAIFDQSWSQLPSVTDAAMVSRAPIGGERAGASYLQIERATISGQQVFIKTAPETMLPSTSRNIMNAHVEALWVRTIDELGIGPRLVGVTETTVNGVRHPSVVTEFIDGSHLQFNRLGQYSGPNNQAVRDQILEIGRRLDAAGIDAIDLQFRVTQQGRVYVIDPELFRPAVQGTSNSSALAQRYVNELSR